MTTAAISMPLYYANALATEVVERVLSLPEQANLPLRLAPIALDKKISQKLRQQLSAEHLGLILLLDEKQQLSLFSGQLNVSPDWSSLQRRVVSAGRKSELLLQACKLNTDQRVLDATAGFGHDSLILASTGAQVVMLERNPIVALLLLYEQQRMAMQLNWQKLMQRLTIICIDSVDYLTQNKARLAQADKFDVVYLDPMFPENSYTHASSKYQQNQQQGKKSRKRGNPKGAKVGKHMQALHQIASPPDSEEEQALLQLALASVSIEADTDDGTGVDNSLKAPGRVVVKRPVSAPVFANQQADEHWQNDVLRFDAYFAHI